jgi:hypothetical protein
VSPDRLPAYGRLRAPSWMTFSFALLTLIGAAAFVTGILGATPLRAWQAYLVNFLFWSGLSFGQICFVAVLNMTDARWGRPLKRLCEAFGACLPVIFLLFWVLYFGREELFPWIDHPPTSKAAWLSVPFLFARDGAAMLLLSLVSLGMVYSSVKADARWTADPTRHDNRMEEGSTFARSWRTQKALSPVVAILYVFVLTLLGFDLVMSLDPHWNSTLFGGYYFIGSFYGGIAALCFLSLVTMGLRPLAAHLRPRHFHDLGKLLFAFCLFTGYLFYAQFLVIWYGNIAEETRYVILRVKLTPWEPLAWAVLLLIFIVPFVALLSKKLKLLRFPMISLSLLILIGLWFERLILVAPSLWKYGGIPFGATEILVTAGFLGVVGICMSTFLRMFPALPVSDPLFRESVGTPDMRPVP